MFGLSPHTVLRATPTFSEKNYLYVSPWAVATVLGTEMFIFRDFVRSDRSSAPRLQGGPGGIRCH